MTISDDFYDPEAGEERDPTEQDCAFFSLAAVINKALKGALIRALREAHGNCHRAAQLLDISRYTVYRMIARYGLASHRGRQHGLGALAMAKSDSIHG